MPFRYAIASGNWSNPAIWDGGVSIPSSGDDVRSNNFIVTIDQNVTVLSLSNKSETSPVIAAGGYFDVQSSRTITANIIGGVNSTPAVRFLSAAGLTLNVVGTCSGGAGVANSYGLGFLGAGGALNVTGNIRGGTISGSFGLYVNNTTLSTTTIVGAVGNNADAQTALYTQACSGTFTITGSVVNCSTQSGASFSNGGSNLTCTIYGNVTTNGSGLPLQWNNNNGILRVYGTVTAAGSYNAISAGSSAYPVEVSGPLIPAANGCVPVFAAILRRAPVETPTYIGVRKASQLATDNFYTPDYASAFDQPATANVRQGTVYGIGGALTGTLAVPPPGSVALGVPTDNTTGTAAITQQAIADAVGPLIAAYGS